MHLTKYCVRLGNLGIVALLSCSILISGCSGSDTQGDKVAVSAQESIGDQGGIKEIESLVASSRTTVIEADSKKVLSPDLRHRLLNLLATSTVEPYGLRPGDPVDGIAAPPIPPPALVLWVVENTVSASAARFEDALAVIEIHTWSVPFAQAYQSNKPRRFILENAGWIAFVTAIEEEWGLAQGK